MSYTWSSAIFVVVVNVVGVGVCGGIQVLDFSWVCKVKQEVITFMLVHGAWRPARKLKGLVCSPYVVPSNQMATYVQYWASDFVIWELSIA